MKVLLAVLVVIVLIVVGLGFYRGWFQFSSDNTDNNPNATISVNKDKMQADKEKVQGLGHKAPEKTGGQAEEVKDQERQP
jgi:predicted negative regulator of RcsB-dependent stress response